MGPAAASPPHGEREKRVGGRGGRGRTEVCVAGLREGVERAARYDARQPAARRSAPAPVSARRGGARELAQMRICGFENNLVKEQERVAVSEYVCLRSAISKYLLACAESNLSLWTMRTISVVYCRVTVVSGIRDETKMILHVMAINITVMNQHTLAKAQPSRTVWIYPASCSERCICHGFVRLHRT